MTDKRMNKTELKEYITKMVAEINSECRAKRIALYDELYMKLKEYFEDVDYVSYEDGVLSNSYINFDSNCGLSLICANTDIQHIVEVADKPLRELTLRDTISLMTEIGDRREYWTDLIDDNIIFEYSADEIADQLMSILDDWVGEEQFKEDILAYAPMDTLNAVWKYLCKGKPGNGTGLSQFYVSNPNEVAQAFWNGVLTVLEIEGKITSEGGMKIWKELIETK